MYAATVSGGRVTPLPLVSRIVKSRKVRMPDAHCFRHVVAVNYGFLRPGDSTAAFGLCFPAPVCVSSNVDVQLPLRAETVSLGEHGFEHVVRRGFRPASFSRKSRVRRGRFCAQSQKREIYDRRGFGVVRGTRSSKRLVYRSTGFVPFCCVPFWFVCCSNPCGERALGHVSVNECIRDWV